MSNRRDSRLLGWAVVVVVIAVIAVVALSTEGSPRQNNTNTTPTSHPNQQPRQGNTGGAEPPLPAKGKVGESLSRPAPPSVLNGLKSSSGKEYVEKSKALPSVVSTG